MDLTARASITSSPRKRGLYLARETVIIRRWPSCNLSDSSFLVASSSACSALTDAMKRSFVSDTVGDTGGPGTSLKKSGDTHTQQSGSEGTYGILCLASPFPCW